MHKAKTAIEATHYVTPPILLKKLLNQNDELESIQRALEIYLESKRQLFPRFYFISNDDLLEVRTKILLPPYYNFTLVTCKIDKSTVAISLFTTSN